MSGLLTGESTTQVSHN